MRLLHQSFDTTPALLRRRYLWVLLLLLQVGSDSAWSQFGESVQYFPQFAIGAGATTFFSIHNPGTETITVKIELYLSDGSLLASQEVQLAAGATQTVKLERAGATTVGWAQLTSAGKFTAGEFFQFTDATGNLISEVGVLPSSGTDRFKLFGFVQRAGGTRTGIAVANPLVPRRRVF